MEQLLKQCTRAALGVTLAAVLLAGCAGQETGPSVSAPPMSESAAQTDGAAVEQLLKGEHTLTALPTGYMDTPLTQSSRGQAWRDEMGFVRVRLGDVYLITEPVTGLPARLSIYGLADAPADPMALLEEWRTLLWVDVLPDWEETETVQAGATELRSAQGRLRLQVCAAHETFLLEAASFS